MLNNYALCIMAVFGLTAYAKYWFDVRNKLLNIAAATVVDIQLTWEAQLDQLREHQPALVAKLGSDEPYVGWSDRRSNAVYEFCGNDLWLLPEDCARKVILFYEYDGALRGSVMAMCSDSFPNLAPENRKQHFEERFRDLCGKYLNAREEALAALNLITTKKRLLF